MDNQEHWYSRLPSVRNSSYPHTQNRRKSLFFPLSFSLFRCTEGVRWCLFSLWAPPDLEGGFNTFTTWNRDPSALNAAWDLMSRTILSLKVSHVYFSYSCLERDSLFLHSEGVDAAGCFQEKKKKSQPIRKWLLPVNLTKVWPLTC